MDRVRAAMNYSAALLASTTSHTRPAEAELRFQPASIYLLIKSKPLSLRNGEISGMQRDNDRGSVLK